MMLSSSTRVLLAACLLATTVVAFGPLGAHPVGAADRASVSCASGPAATTAPAPKPTLASFRAIAPRRLIDTRTGTGGVAAPVGAGCTLRLRVGSGVAPANADALALSVTALAQQPGYVTVFPCSSGRPATSNLNARAEGFPTPNLVIALPDATRDVCIYSLFEADILVDLTGWWTQDGGQRFTSIPPVRVDDSRNDPGRVAVAAGATRTVKLGDVVPPGTTAVVANLTVTEPAADGFITAFPCGAKVPKTSNLNFRAGESRAVAMIIGVDAAAQLCLRSIVDHHVIVDVSGYYSPAPQFGPAAALRPLRGTRLADSRSGRGGWSGKFTDGSIRRLRPAQGFAFGPQATAAVLNVVATEADDPGYVTVYPCDAEVPTTSAVNFSPGGESTNMVTVDLSAGGEVCLFTRGSVHLVVDLFGLLTAPDDALAERMAFDGYTWPPFTPDGTDYAVECGNRANELHLDLLSSVKARVNGVPVSSGSTNLTLRDDDLTWVQLRRGSEVRNMWFRCVPAAFPRLEVERVGEPTSGWYLTTLRASTESRTFAAILDERGALVWYKQIPQVMHNLNRRSDGRLTIAPALGPRYGVLPDAGYWVMSLSGTLVDEHLTVDDPTTPGVAYPTDHHDYVSLTNGRRAMLTYPLLADQDLSVLGDGFLADDTIADGVVQEIDANGNLIWSWRTSDHIGYDEVTYPVRWGPLPGYNGNEVDVFHLNSLSVADDGSGDYLVSARHLDAVLRIDRASGDLDWILGSLPPGAPNKDGATRLTIVNDPLGGPRRAHDARMTGNVLTLLDNRTDTGQAARAVAYEIDESAGTATLLWQIRAPQRVSSLGLGSNRVAADGSVLVDWGAGVQPMFEEFDDQLDAVMRITQVDGGQAYRIIKERPSAFSASVLRATAGGFAESP